LLGGVPTLGDGAGELRRVPHGCGWMGHDTPAVRMSCRVRRRSYSGETATGRARVPDRTGEPAGERTDRYIHPGEQQVRYRYPE
jgi:hypothetical protein